MYIYFYLSASTTSLYSTPLKSTVSVVSRSCSVVHPPTSLREVRPGRKDFTVLLFSVRGCDSWHSTPVLQDLLVRRRFMWQWWTTTWRPPWLWWTEPLNSSMSLWPPSFSKVHIHGLTDTEKQQIHMKRWNVTGYGDGFSFTGSN